MGRAPARRATGYHAAASPLEGAAGAIQSRKVKRESVRRQTSVPVNEVAHAVTGLTRKNSSESVLSFAPEYAGKKTQGSNPNAPVTKRPSKKLIEMHQTQTSGLLQYGDPGKAPEMDFSSAKGEESYAGRSSSSLAAHSGVSLGQVCDTSTSRKAMPFRGNHSVVDTVVFGMDNDDSENADKRDFSNAAGNPSSAKVLEPPPRARTHKEPNQVFTLVFGRDVAGVPNVVDKRDFEGAAGNRSYTADLQGIFAPENDRIRFEDIPHSKFSTPGLRKVDAMGSRAEEIIYQRPENPEDTDHTNKPYYAGAAGESTTASDKRYERELLVNKTKLRPGTSTADKLIFGHDLDNSDGADGDQADLYTGAGSRSNTGFNELDMSTRNTSLMTDELLYGSNAVVGNTRIAEPNDPRDFTDHAGNSTKYLSERNMSTFDISQRKRQPHTAAHASQADELIFGGRNIDNSGKDTRDFEKAAGHGAKLGRRNMHDITTTPQKRSHPKALQYAGADTVIYGHALHKSNLDAHARSLVKSRSDELLDEGQEAGNISEFMDKKAQREANGTGFHRAVNERTFNLISGENSTLVSDLVEQNPEFQGAAGVTSAILDRKKVEDHRRFQDQCRDMVPDPHVPPGTGEMKPFRVAEFAKLHASTMDSIIYNRDLDGSDSDVFLQKKEEGERVLKYYAGLSSEKIATMNMTNIDDADGWGLKMQGPREQHQGAAGRLGSTAVYETRSRRASHPEGVKDVGGKDHVHEVIDFTRAQEEEESEEQVDLRSSTYTHHSEDRVGGVVFGMAPAQAPKRKQAPLMDRDGNNLGGKQSGPSLQSFEGAAGARSHDRYGDLTYKLDDKPARPRLHMMSEVDEVVFGHDVDGSLMFGEREWKGAGKSSKKMHAGKHWKRRDIGRREHSGIVDEVVFGHDVDRSTSLELGTQLRAAAGPEQLRAAGASSAAVLSSQHLNDPRARMHYDTEFYRHERTGNEETLDREIFNHAMGERDQSDSPVSRMHRQSSSFNRLKPQIGMQRKQMVPLYDANRAEVDEIIYGRELTPTTYTEEDVARLQHMRAGKSSVTKELEVRSESKKMVSHEHGHALALLFPEEEEHQFSRAALVRGNTEFNLAIAEQQAAGSSSLHHAHSKFREMELMDGYEGARKARGPPKQLEGAAGKKIDKESKDLQSRGRPSSSSPTEVGSTGRPFGKPSGLTYQGDSCGVASVLNQSSSAAYEEALAEGRAMLATPYTGAPSAVGAASGLKVDPGRTQCVAPKYGEGDAAGNFRKEPRHLVNKPRPENNFGQKSPFGVDVAESSSRFMTSSSSIGSLKKERLDVVPGAGQQQYAAPSRVQTAIVATSSNVFPAAGQRPKIPVGPRS
ncbi:hypothetical protein AB1Y20_018721 [Prymnesium parvum]|uniref:Uncharacterized protein n=1 Tax=Prymnesium parvum TaxID=97485 RepID=A0AB34JS94_PRYPA